MFNTKEYIGSLHRPFNTRLITVKWVCNFYSEYEGSQFRIDFFVYIIELLHEEYKNIKNIYGLPKKETIDILYSFIKGNSEYKDKLLEFTVNKKNTNALDKQIYSNLKAVSYYTTLAKNLGFLEKDELSKAGESLLLCQDSRKTLGSITSNEEVIFIEQLLKHDFVPFIFTLFYTYFERKYPLIHSEKESFNDRFLKKLDIYLNKRDFKLKRKSWRNYIIVRQSWINDLGLLQSNNVIKSKVKKIISLNYSQKREYENIEREMKEFDRSFFQKLEKFRKFKNDLYSAYMNIKRNNIFGNVGYINLYDIKKELKISTKELELFLEMLHDEEVNRKKIFFNNIVASIDSRKRFIAKNTQVLNIKITGKLL